MCAGTSQCNAGRAAHSSSPFSSSFQQIHRWRISRSVPAQLSWCGAGPSGRAVAAVRRQGCPPAFPNGADQGMQKIGNQEKPVQFCNRRAWQYAVQTQCFSGGVPAVLPNLQTRLLVTRMSREIRGWDEESAVGRLPAPLASAACESFPQTRLVFAVKEGSVPPREGAGCWRVLRWGGPSGGCGRWHRCLVMPTPCLSRGQFPTSSSAVPTTLSIFQNFPGKMALPFPFCG